MPALSVSNKEVRRRHGSPPRTEHDGIITAGENLIAPVIEAAFIRLATGARPRTVAAPKYSAVSSGFVTSPIEFSRKDCFRQVSYLTE